MPAHSLLSRAIIRPCKLPLRILKKPHCLPIARPRSLHEINIAHTTSPMTPVDFRTYNRMAEKMDGLHEHFRMQWGVMHTAAVNSCRPKGMSLRSYLQLCLGFCEQLVIHHTIEETHVFPVLATRMPAFHSQGRLVAEHGAIHSGLENLEAYCNACLQGTRDFQWSEIRGTLGSFGAVLWEHLGAEVRELGAEKMHKYWSRDEVLRMPM